MWLQPVRSPSAALPPMKLKNGQADLTKERIGDPFKCYAQPISPATPNIPAIARSLLLPIFLALLTHPLRCAVLFSVASPPCTISSTRQDAVLF